MNMNRKEITNFLSELLKKDRLTGLGKHWSSEVSIDPFTTKGRRVDFMEFIMTMWRILPLLKWRDESMHFLLFLQKYQITLKMISYKRKENTKDESTHNDEPGTGIWHQQTE